MRLTGDRTFGSAIFEICVDVASCREASRDIQIAKAMRKENDLGYRAARLLSGKLQVV